MSMAPCQSAFVHQAHVGPACTFVVTKRLRQNALPILNSLEPALNPTIGSSAPSLRATLRVDHPPRISSGRPPVWRFSDGGYQSPGLPPNDERNIVGMSRVLFEEPRSGTQHHVAALERTLGLINVTITFSLQKAHHSPLHFNIGIAHISFTELTVKTP